jgi:predicted permease
MFNDIRYRVRSLFWRKSMEAELDEELRAHFAGQVQKHLLSGLTLEEARRRARLEFGRFDQVKEECRDARGISFIETTIQDLRYALRVLGKNPGFTTVAVLALALGIGANTAVFSVMYGVLLRPLPYPEPERLVWLSAAGLRTGQVYGGAISPPDFIDYRSRATIFEHLAAYTPIDTILAGNGQADRVPSTAVSAGFFEVLGAKPALGRTIQTPDEQFARPQVVVLSYGLWQSRFGADPQLIGRTINVDGQSMTIVGVMPAGFEFPKSVQLWSPLPFRSDEMQVRRFHFLRVIGRLKRGVTLGQAAGELQSISVSLAQTYPDSNADFGVKPVALQEQLVGNMRPTLTVLMIAVGLVLLIACANVAQLVLARATTRHREIAIRTSLGASGGRVIRQLLTESVLLALLGGTLGTLLAVEGLQALIAMKPANVPRLDQVHLDLRALVFTAALSILTGLVFGLAPALRVSKLEVTKALKERDHGVSAGRSNRLLHPVLVSAELTVSVVLLIVAALMIRSLVRLQNVNPGFEPAGVLTLQVSLPRFGANQSDMSRGPVFFTQLLNRLRAVPGVEYVGLISELPLSGQENDTYFTIEGRPAVAPSDRPDEDARVTSTDYFRAMGIPLVAGRYFTESDNRKTAKVAIISESFAQKYFPHQNPLDQHLVIDFGTAFRCEIVGIVGDVHHHAMASPLDPIMYVPYAQTVMSNAGVVIRSQTPGLGLLSAVRREVQALDRDIPIYGVHKMDEFVSDSVAAPRFRTLLLGMFAALALLLAAAGIFAVVSYGVTQRTHEIGVRMALGAGGRDVMKLVLGQQLVWAIGGVVVGLLAALALARLISSLLYQIRPADPLSFVAVPVVLLAVAMAASYLPARRASKVDPMVSLRHE